jgi:large subunit ribosomal protein L24
MAAKFRIKKGDRVIVLAGRDRGRQGEVLRVLREEGRVLVQGVNMVKRHTKPNPRTGGGGIVEKEAPIHVSKVACVDPQSSRPTRVGFRFLEDGRKVRYAKRSGEVLSS